VSPGGKPIKKSKKELQNDADELGNTLQPQVPLEQLNDSVVPEAVAAIAAAEAVESAKRAAKAKREAAQAAKEAENVAVFPIPAVVAVPNNAILSSAKESGLRSKFATVVEGSKAAVEAAKASERIPDIDEDDESLGIKAELPYECHLDKQTILTIWRTPRQQLKSDEERTILTLLLKYNGTFDAYQAIIDQSNRRKKNLIQTGAHVQWEKQGKLVPKDIDFRARQLLREIDRYCWIEL